MDTANDTVTVDEGVRVRVGHWDAIIDGTVMDGCSTNLSSVGQRVMNAGFTHIWSRGKFQCFISPDAKSVIIFDLAGVVPIYSPAMEDFKHTKLGSFALNANEFRSVCGIWMNEDGRLEVDILPEHSRPRNPHQRNRA